MLTLSPKLPVLPSTCRGNWGQRPVFTRKAYSTELVGSVLLSLSKVTFSYLCICIEPRPTVHDLVCNKVRQRNPLGSLGVSRFLFLYISTCILYDSQHSRAFGNSHFGWWVKMSQVPPMAATALIRFVRNFSKSLTSRMLSSTGCLGVISWDVKPNARETCMTALTSIGYKL